ncbi:fibrinogen-like protein 1-like protein [Protopterus annectens]|uniref:fibrinogen-like protein 1-like protein n=1 Tax=Protopterus annectens TaxID=7888 RepID=UPI001CFBAC6A|nr:fibrinogen-like protein 1-like protein [Protopterus annectens]
MEQIWVLGLLFFCSIFSADSLESYPKDCSVILKDNPSAPSGQYVIQPGDSPALVVNCEMRSDAGWTVIQRNSKGSPITWSESWTTYQYGFGDILGDHWIGLEYIHLLTDQRSYKLRIEFYDSSNILKYAEYDSFYVESVSDMYRIRLGSYEGTAGDQMTKAETNLLLDNTRFTTKDKDNDRGNGNCASNRGGGWWYGCCADGYLNVEEPFWKNLNVARVLMMILPVKC